MFVIRADVGVGSSTCRAEDPLLHLRLIGPPVVRLGGRKLTHQQQSLVAFVGLCGPVSGDDIAHALWQGRVMSPSRLPNLLAEVRGVIGRQRLPAADDGYYRLSDVCSDVTRLETLCGSRQAGYDWLTAALGALAEVNGLPLHRSAGAGRAYWIWLERCFVQRAHVERQVTQLAAAACDALTATGRTQEAVWALEQALRAVPDDDQLQQRLAALYRVMGYRVSARTVSARVASSGL